MNMYTEIPVRGNEELIEAFLHLASYGRVHWIYGKSSDPLGCDISMRLKDNTKISLTYSDFFGGSVKGWVNSNYQFIFTWRTLWFKRKGFPKMKTLLKIIRSRKKGVKSDYSAFVEDKLQMFLKEIKESGNYLHNS